MNSQEYPYKVTKASTTAPKRVYLLIPCEFIGGPLRGSNLKVVADDQGLPPAIFKNRDHYDKGEGANMMGQYYLRPGTHDYVWR